MQKEGEKTDNKKEIKIHNFGLNALGKITNPKILTKKDVSYLSSDFLLIAFDQMKI